LGRSLVLAYFEVMVVELLTVDVRPLHIEAVHQAPPADIADCGDDLRRDASASAAVVSRDLSPDPDQAGHLQHRDRLALLLGAVLLFERRLAEAPLGVARIITSHRLNLVKQQGIPDLLLGVS
jgi:hypothetical protein